MKTKFLSNIAITLLGALSLVACSAKQPEETVQLRIDLDRTVLPAGSSGHAIVKICLDGLRLPRAEARPPVNLSIVIDRSGSMEGEKLARAREAALEALNRLAPDDVISVVIEMHKLRGAAAPGAAPRRGASVTGEQEALFLRLEATAIYYTALVIERVATARRGVTARTQRAATAGNEAIEWFVNWTTRSAAPDFKAFFLESRPRLASHLLLEVTHSVANGALVPSRFVLRSDYPFSISTPCPPWIAMAVGSCDGKTTVREVFEGLQRQQVVPSGLTVEQFAANVREMVARGFLELDEFKLPA